MHGGAIIERKNFSKILTMEQLEVFMVSYLSSTLVNSLVYSIPFMLYYNRNWW